MKRLRGRRLLVVAVLALIITVSRTWAQDCAPAGKTIRIQARASGADTIAVRFTVVNSTRDTLRWISMGNGGDERTVAVPAQAPEIKGTPSGWRGIVVYPEETAYVHLWWEATAGGTGIEPGASATGFAVRAAGPNAVRAGLIGSDGRPVRPLDFTRLPFTAGGSRGGCWWGRITPPPQR